MRLVVDTNIILGALIKNSTTRSILQSPNHSFYVPEYAVDEVRKYFSLIVSKSGLNEGEVKLLFDLLLSNLQVVPSEKILTRLEQAERALKSIDKKDVPFLAQALSIDCDGIWSNDEDLKKQKLVKVWTTIEILETIK